MLYTINHADLERREILTELVADVATLAGTVKDTQPGLNPDQREALEALIVASRVVRERFDCMEAVW